MLSTHHRTLVIIDKSDGAVLCRLDKTPACSTGCGGCAESSVIASLPSALIQGTNHNVGDSVEFEASGEMLLVLSSLVYLSPVLLMLLFSVGCSFLFPGSEATVALAALVGLGVGLGAVFLFGRHADRQRLGGHLALRGAPANQL